MKDKVNGTPVVSGRRTWKHEAVPEPAKSTSTKVDDTFPAPVRSEAFHGVVGEIVQMLGPQTEADPAALLIHLLTEVGNIFGRNVYSTAGGTRHHCNIFSVLVGNTSKGRKGTAAAAVRHVTKVMDSDWYENRVRSGLSSGEGVKWAVRDAVYREEQVKKNGRRTGETETVCVDEGVTDKRLLAVEGEFASVLQVMARDKNTLSAILRLAWDGHRLAALTKNDPITVTDAHISVIGHITREELAQLMSATESANGFGNRFLWIAVQRSKFLPEGGDLSRLDFRPAVAHLTRVRELARTLGEVRRDNQAKALWAELYPTLSKAKPGLLGKVTDRAEAQVLRLSLLYALLDQSTSVRVEHLRAALAVWDYSERSAKWIFGNSTGNRNADMILTALQRVGIAGLSETEINVDVFNRHQSSEQIHQALGVLAQGQLAVCQKLQTTGRPAQRWYASEVVPKQSTAPKGAN